MHKHSRPFAACSIIIAIAKVEYIALTLLYDEQLCEN